MAPAILPDSISTTAVPARAMTDGPPDSLDGFAFGVFPSATNDGTAAPALITSAALFKIVLRSMPVPLLDGFPDPLFFFMVAPSYLVCFP
jgi:hypothetical protein